MSLKRSIITGALLCVLYSASYGQTQPRQEYFRTFSVELKNLDEETEQKLNNLFNQRDNFQLDLVCSGENKCLIAVNANYPKRIGAIENELREMLTSQLGKRTVVGVKSIPVSEKNTYCP